MRYIKHFFEDIDGIAIYPIISMLIFVAFFIVLTLYVVRMRKGHASYMAAVPLEASEPHTPEAPQP